MNHIRRSRRTSLSNDERGQTLAEYSILVACIVVVVVLSLPAVAGAVEGLLAPAVAFFGG